MLRKKITYLMGGVSVLLPFVALATPKADLSWFLGAAGWLYVLVIRLVPMLIGIAVAVFFWGIIRYVRAADDPEGRKQGRNLMIYGVIAIFVMVAIWGLVALVGTIVGADMGTGTAPPAPTLP